MAIILTAIILLFYLGLHARERPIPLFSEGYLFPQKKNMVCAEFCLGGSKKQRCK